MNVRLANHGLIDELQRASVDYELISHPRTMTARAEARVLELDPGEVAKTVVLTTPIGFVRAVLPASERLDLAKAQRILGSKDIRLATEEVIAGAYPDFELGAVPPLPCGGDRVLVDRRLCEQDSVVFEAGTHVDSVRLRTSDLLELCKAEVADLCRTA